MTNYSVKCKSDNYYVHLKCNLHHWSINISGQSLLILSRLFLLPTISLLDFLVRNFFSVCPRKTGSPRHSIVSWLSVCLRHFEQKRRPHFRHWHCPCWVWDGDVHLGQGRRSDKVGVAVFWWIQGSVVLSCSLVLRVKRGALEGPPVGGRLFGNPRFSCKRDGKNMKRYWLRPCFILAQFDSHI